MSAAPFVACGSHGPGHVIAHRGPAAGAVIKGDQLSMGDARPYLDTEEPTAEEAGQLWQQLLDLGTVARLDLLHDALRTAYRRGRAAEHAEVERLAQEHAAAFTSAVAQRARAQATRDALPWYQQ